MWMHLCVCVYIYIYPHAYVHEYYICLSVYLSTDKIDEFIERCMGFAIDVIAPRVAAAWGLVLVGLQVRGCTCLNSTKKTRSC